MPKKFVTKPQYVEAMYFDGTLTTARDIVAWVKDYAGEDNYLGSQIKGREERYFVGIDTPSEVKIYNDLHINTRSWLGSIVVEPDCWLLFAENDGFRSVSNDWFKSKYAEVEGE